MLTKFHRLLLSLILFLFLYFTGGFALILHLLLQASIYSTVLFFPFFVGKALPRFNPKYLFIPLISGMYAALLYITFKLLKDINAITVLLDLEEDPQNKSFLILFPVLLITLSFLFGIFVKKCNKKDQEYSDRLSIESEELVAHQMPLYLRLIYWPFALLMLIGILSFLFSTKGQSTSDTVIFSLIMLLPLSLMIGLWYLCNFMKIHYKNSELSWGAWPFIKNYNIKDIKGFLIVNNEVFSAILKNGKRKRIEFMSAGAKRLTQIISEIPELENEKIKPESHNKKKFAPR